MQGQFGDSVAFLGLNIRDSSAEKGLAFARNHEVNYRCIYSPDGAAFLAFSGTLHPRSIPSTVVLDSQGRVAAPFRPHSNSANAGVAGGGRQPPVAKWLPEVRGHEANGWRRGSKAALLTSSVLRRQ